MSTNMTVDRLVAEARRNRTGVASPGLLEPESIDFALRTALDCLLGGIDYEHDRGGGGAIAARMLASLVVCVEEIAAARNRH